MGLLQVSEPCPKNRPGVRFTKALGVKLPPKLVTLLQTLGADFLTQNCFVKRTPEPG